MLPLAGWGGCARGDRLHLGLRNLYILPTRFGWLWLAGALVLLVVSIQMQQNGPLLLGLLLLALSVLTLHLTHFNLQGVELRCDHPPPGFAAVPLAYPLCIRCPARCEGLQLRFDGAETETTLSLAPGVHQLVVPWWPRQRGWHPPGTLRLQTTAPLGLFRCWTRWRPSEPQLVYPAPAPGPVGVVPATTDPGGDPRRQAGSPDGSDDWLDLRPHRPEDSPARLAWKLLARGRGRLTKSFSADSPEPFLLTPDPAVPFEQALSHLSDRICRLHERGETYGLLLPGGRIAPGQGRAQRDRCLAALALAR